MTPAVFSFAGENPEILRVQLSCLGLLALVLNEMVLVLVLACIPIEYEYRLTPNGTHFVKATQATALYVVVEC